MRVQNLANVVTVFQRKAVAIGGESMQSKLISVSKSGVDCALSVFMIFAANRELMGCALFFLCRCFERRKRSCSIATCLPFLSRISGIRRRTNDGGKIRMSSQKTGFIEYLSPCGGGSGVARTNHPNRHRYAVPICRFRPDRISRKLKRGFDSLSLKKSETDAGFSSSIS